MKAILTGAAGNLGTSLRARSADRYAPFGRSDWSRLTEVLAPDIDTIVHAAWDLTTPISANPVGVIEDNVLATVRLLEAIRDRGVSTFAYVSTCAVYGSNRDTEEHSDVRPITVNGITKLLNERIVEETCSKLGIAFQIYRVFNMYGGTDRFSIFSHLARALRDDVPFVLNNAGAAVRDFIHVDDVARIIDALLSVRLPVMVVNVGTGRPTRIADVVRLLQQHHPELKIEHRSVAEIEYSCANVSRLEQLLGPQQFLDVDAYIERVFGSAANSHATG